MIKEFEYGKIEYRLPNIPEAMELLGVLGIQTDGTYSESQFVLMAKMIKHLKNFITNIEVKIEELEIKDFDSLLNHFEAMGALTDICNEVFSKLSMGDKKKH